MSSSTFSRSTVPDMTYYDLLNVSVNANTETIDQAYRQAIQLAHADHGGSDALFQDVRQAHKVLSNDALRKAYDRYGQAGVQQLDTPSQGGSYASSGMTGSGIGNPGFDATFYQPTFSGAAVDSSAVWGPGSGLTDLFGGSSMFGDMGEGNFPKPEGVSATFSRPASATLWSSSPFGDSRIDAASTAAAAVPAPAASTGTPSTKPVGMPLPSASDPVATVLPPRSTTTATHPSTFPSPFPTVTKMKGNPLGGVGGGATGAGSRPPFATTRPLNNPKSTPFVDAVSPTMPPELSGLLSQDNHGTNLSGSKSQPASTPLPHQAQLPFGKPIGAGPLPGVPSVPAPSSYASAYDPQPPAPTQDPKSVGQSSVQPLAPTFVPPHCSRNPTAQDDVAEIVMTLEELRFPQDREVEFKVRSACPICSGRGMLVPSSESVCSGCQGTGEEASRAVSFQLGAGGPRKCFYCQGSGKERQAAQACIDCNGRGIAASGPTKSFRHKVSVRAGAREGEVVGEWPIGNNDERVGRAIVRVHKHPWIRRERDGMNENLWVVSSKHVKGMGWVIRYLDSDGTHDWMWGELPSGAFVRTGDVVKVPRKGLTGRGSLYVILRASGPSEDPETFVANPDSKDAQILGVPSTAPSNECVGSRWQKVQLQTLSEDECQSFGVQTVGGSGIRYEIEELMDLPE